MTSIRTTVHESLPYVDPEPTPSERAAAESLIAAEASSSSSSSSSTTPQTKPTLPPLRTPNFSPLMTAELSRIGSKQPLSAIDLSRYEAPSPPSSPSATNPSTLETDLRRAYTASTYLRGRQAHLQLLDAYGKNAWLVGNWQLEAEVQALERDLAASKREIDLVNIRRRRLQDDVGGELRGLDDAWKRGVSRVLETEIATEELRQQVLEKQRGGG